jgi:hypothetical protein
MKLVRNTTDDGKCKFALIERLKDNKVEFGLPHTENEFFVIKLKDANAKEALEAYANAAESTDPELASEVRELALRAGVNSKFCKQPD